MNIIVCIKQVPDTAEVREYRKNLRIISKLDMERKIGSLSEQEFENLLDAIQRCEGWYPGDEKFEPAPDKVIGVKFLRHKATEFLVVSASGIKKWITRTQAIAHAKSKRLFVVVVHGRYGIHLRPFPHHPTFHDMIIR